VLSALAEAVERGVEISGVYHGPEMDMALRNFEKSTKTGQAKIALWDAVKDRLIPKHSTPYSPNGPHDFMHNKVLVVDRKRVVTGSFNFSQNATKNAENMITMHDETIAGQYDQYIKNLVSKYR